MAYEVRRIVFSMEEVAVIMMAYSGRITNEEAIVFCDVPKADPVSVAVHTQTMEGQQREYLFDQDQCLSSIIVFCRESRVRLPKKAEKSIRRLDEGLCLNMVLRGH